jgi:3-methyl-2-oxobutanoate hydroxymethyltransferase
VPRFCKKYAQVGEAIRIGLEAFKEEVQQGQFPSEAFCPYKVIDAQSEGWTNA